MDRAAAIFVAAEERAAMRVEAGIERQERRGGC
jgi:hypothetical protein